jgi:hypothetical protein
MGEMELALLEGRKEGHQAIVAAITALEGLGYLVSGIQSKDCTLEIRCYPPHKEEGNSRG